MSSTGSRESAHSNPSPTQTHERRPAWRNRSGKRVHLPAMVVPEPISRAHLASWTPGNQDWENPWQAG